LTQKQDIMNKKNFYKLQLLKQKINKTHVVLYCKFSVIRVFAQITM